MSTELKEIAKNAIELAENEFKENLEESKIINSSLFKYLNKQDTLTVKKIIKLIQIGKDGKPLNQQSFNEKFIIDNKELKEEVDSREDDILRELHILSLINEYKSISTYLKNVINYID